MNVVKVFIVLLILFSSQQSVLAQSENDKKEVKFHPIRLIKNIILFPVNCVKYYINDVEQVIYVKQKYST